MNKITYQQKLDTTVLKDTDTIADLKAAQKLKKQLEAFWKREALMYLKRYKNDDLAGRIKNGEWIRYTFAFDLKATGVVKVQVFAVNDMSSDVPANLYTIRKEEILEKSNRKLAKVKKPVVKPSLALDPITVSLDANDYLN